eukprot:6211336-Pleurochrysis_carterae.AAC.1
MRDPTSRLSAQLAHPFVRRARLPSFVSGERTCSDLCPLRALTRCAGAARPLVAAIGVERGAAPRAFLDAQPAHRREGAGDARRSW